jgi:hypothetical protein
VRTNMLPVVRSAEECQEREECVEDQRRGDQRKGVVKRNRKLSM